MNREDIIRMAREAGMLLGRFDIWDAETPDLERFVALVAAAEREACAKLCEWKTGLKPVDTAIETCAAAIRARSES
jgi:hypothetical protein